MLKRLKCYSRCIKVWFDQKYRKFNKAATRTIAASIKQISDFIARLEQGAPAKPKNQKIEQVKKNKLMFL